MSTARSGRSARGSTTTTSRATARRAGNTPLPAINLRASTAYGTNTIPAPRMRTRQTTTVEEAIEQALNGGRNSDDVDTASLATERSGRGRDRPKRASIQEHEVNGNRTYGDESQIYHEAAFDTSSISQPTGLQGGKNNGIDGYPKEYTNDLKVQQLRLQQEAAHALNNNQPNGYYTNEPQLPTPERRRSQQKVRSQQRQVETQPLPTERTKIQSRQSESQKHREQDHLDTLRKLSEGLRQRTPDRSGWTDILRNKIGEYLNYISFALQRVWDGLKGLWNGIINFLGGFKDLWKVWLSLLFLLVLVTPLLTSSRDRSDIFDDFESPLPSSSSYRSYDFDLRHNIGQYIPDWIAHPLDSIKNPFDAIKPDFLQDVQSGLRKMEYKYTSLRKQNELGSKAIERIEKSLPDFLVVKKDTEGILQIPQDFWNALRELIRQDGDLAPELSNKYSSTSLSLKDLQHHTAGLWDKYIRENQAKIGTLVDSEIQKKFPDLLNHNILASKSEVIKMLQQNWQDSQDQVKAELETLSKKFEKVSQHINRLDRDSAGLSKAQIKKIVAEHIKQILPTAQLEALAKANQNANVQYGLSKVNHWSHGTGAIIDPIITSNNFAFEDMNKGFFQRTMRQAFGNRVPPANPPEAAITKWDEHGDCWCSPTEDEHGRVPTLAVMSSNGIFPDEVVVEHIASSATLEPGAAPREMELLAYIPDFDKYDAAKRLSDELFPREAPVQAPGNSYVRIATWTFDALSGGSIQAFAVQLDLKQFTADTKKLIVRSKNNWSNGNVEYTCLYRVRIHGELGLTPGL